MKSMAGFGGGVASLSMAGSAAAEPGQQAFTSAGQYAWSVPAGVTEISAVLIGGGGGGSASTLPSNGVSGGGGGGGALSWRNNINISGQSTLYITVGSGGSGGDLSTNNATSGGDSYIRIGSHSGTILARAGGGTRGAYNNPVASAQPGGTNYSSTYGGGGSTSGGGNGGRGGRGQSGHQCGGGGGAGGYSGDGGRGSDGSNSDATAGSGGGVAVAVDQTALELSTLFMVVEELVYMDRVHQVVLVLLHLELLLVL